MSKYPVIVFEGIEASGKSTCIKKVAQYLNKINRSFVKIREPGGTIYSEIFRKLMLNKKSKFNIKTDLLLIMASRSENLEKVLNKYYGKKIILIDRFTDSTIAYQHYGMGINLNLIKILNKFILNNFRPTFTFINIVNKTNMKKRLNKRIKLNRYDKFDFTFYNKVQKGYLKIANKKNNYFIIDSNKNNIDKNYQIILQKLKKII
tara:strand:+ start:1368 stop:1982 length:615 start_codon:yes stop_codon:yes gene_type:complete